MDVKLDMSTDLGRRLSLYLYPPPPARPAALHASKPRLPASSSAAKAQARLRHAPGAIYRAPVVSTGCNRHANYSN
eukprot:scaffold48573_cov348-Isochrysis_galbana.AAC.1